MNNKKRYWLIEAMDCNLIDQIRKIKIRNQRILIKYADYYSWKMKTWGIWNKLKDRKNNMLKNYNNKLMIKSF